MRAWWLRKVSQAAIALGSRGGGGSLLGHNPQLGYASYFPVQK
jgi:hypothetical protein